MISFTSFERHTARSVQAIRPRSYVIVSQVLDYLVLVNCGWTQSIRGSIHPWQPSIKLNCLFFQMFVRLFVDENLDRSVPISKQPKDKIQAILEACDRQFPEFHERSRKRIRTYLKSCRRMRRSKEQNGWEPVGYLFWRLLSILGFLGCDGYGYSSDFLSLTWLLDFCFLSLGIGWYIIWYFNVVSLLVGNCSL